jgi:DNA-binding transcriptional LysR family regulator
MSQYVERFSLAHPHVRVHIEYLHPDRVYENVLNESVDLGVISFPQSRREFSIIPWRTETMVLACSPEHRFAKLSHISPAQISGEKFVGFDKNLVIRKEIDRFLKRHNVEVEVVLEFDNIEAIKRAVEIASGISILPRPTLDREIGSGTLIAVPLTSKEFVRPLGIIHRRGKKFNANIIRFIELLKMEEAKLAPSSLNLEHIRYEDLKN